MSRNKKLSAPIGIALIILLIGYLFKIQHWPYAFEIEELGQIGIGVFYMIRFILKSNKNLKDIAKLILVVSWVLSNLFIWDYKYLIYLFYLFIAVVLIWFLLEVRDFVYKKKDQLNPLVYIGLSIVALEIISKLMWWPSIAGLHLVALLLISLGFIIDSLKR